MTDTTFKEPFPRTKHWEVHYKSWEDIAEMLSQNSRLIQIRVGGLEGRLEKLYLLKNGDIGILTLEPLQGNVFVDLTMRISEMLKNFRRQRFFEFLLKNVKKAAYEKSLKELELLEKLCEGLEKERDSELSLMNYFLKSEKEVLRFAGYIAKEKREGMILAKNTAKWINNPAVRNFKNVETLYESFQANHDSLGSVWHKKWQPIKNINEYLMIIWQIMSHSDAKKMMWNAPCLIGRRPRLAYFYRKNQQRPIIVTVDERGFIEKVKVLRPIWQDTLKAKYMDNFYKIDDFPNKSLMPF